MICAVFDVWLLTQWINCSYYHLYLLLYYQLQYSSIIMVINMIEVYEV